MKKQKFEDFLNGLFAHEDSFAEAGLYVAQYFNLKEYEEIFFTYQQRENAGEDISENEVEEIYNQMLKYIQWRYPFRYRKMDKYIEENY
ncbi:hypothetical protein M2451_002882 [Dysgonomonas sp. PFB1-18]|uniref:hypothetical protein n=1 Tax=unclassified Dysgonomonas TaxID=2630389 RepID=UPI0013D0F518|nr:MULTISPECIES: hypothetical protein [unclassified Dysgonomonas]MDH6309992.1 hypothetical protein [Dysgonomonas sp. PF1-14]MDH6339901.1 hypothetical protein [Dysgonomonas sp. PF1-16]MDH6381549.1 hypothetical protein [Dysgonomonas sp. PFB1-18]MDH6398814.1 hypothetical protein [Dysgonomonas sp. PF1-23]NDV93658.1 hypothetical protein [Dysgonomonas sp. 521]